MYRGADTVYNLEDKTPKAWRRWGVRRAYPFFSQIGV
jgi:hypothetical protein